ncbi:MAG: hypothetical protein MZV65_02540 [Chromatiales bacterium]|nr:hypothetical protein [Chromatiales bacterium]
MNAINPDRLPAEIRVWGICCASDAPAFYTLARRWNADESLFECDRAIVRQYLTCLPHRHRAECHRAARAVYLYGAGWPDLRIDTEGEDPPYWFESNSVDWLT